MGRNALCEVIAYVCAVLGGIVIILHLYGLIGLVQQNVDVGVIAGGIVVLILAVLQFIAAVFLILGIKKERHQYMAPWVYITAISIIIHIIQLIINRHHSYIQEVVITVINILLWIPEFSMYRELYNNAK